MGDYFSSIADNIDPTNDAMDYTVQDHKSIQAIMSFGDDQSVSFKGISEYLMLLRLKRTLIPKKQRSGTLYHPKLSKWARLTVLYHYVIFVVEWLTANFTQIVHFVIQDDTNMKLDRNLLQTFHYQFN